MGTREWGKGRGLLNDDRTDNTRKHLEVFYILQYGTVVILQLVQYNQLYVTRK